jgi:hypothetical protein
LRLVDLFMRVQPAERAVAHRGVTCGQLFASTDRPPLGRTVLRCSERRAVAAGEDSSMGCPSAEFRPLDRFAKLLHHCKPTIQ